MTGWDLKIGYAPRFGWLRFTPHCPHQDDGPTWNVPFSDLIRQTGIPPQALRAHITEATAAKLPGADLSTEELCDSFIGDCTGKTVLDVGGYDGRAAAVALAHGAQQATCLDNLQWLSYSWDTPQHRPGVSYECGDFMEWEREVDVTLFFNVLYHCTDPWGALRYLRAITRERLLLCSLVVWDDRPVWYPQAPREVNEQDDTVYWCPSDAGLIKLLEVTGWQNIRALGKTTERLVLEATPL